MNGGRTSAMVPAPSNLPAELSEFIGRETELAEICALLGRTRALTLTGVGGAGKTRLALRAARTVAAEYPDGVRLVELAALSDGTLVPRMVANVLGVRGMPGRPLTSILAGALATRRLLLVLDNCEHLVDACAQLAETLLAACPALSILSTTREPLRIAGEVTWRVPPLALPLLGPAPAVDSLSRVESVKLFLARAQARSAQFRMTPENAPAVAAICRGLEGLPLALELAAAQMGAFSSQQIEASLSDALGVLAGGSRTQPRQETLRATLDWSHRLLAPTERVLFRRLAVFSGGFEAEEVENVVVGGGDIDRGEVPRLLAGLVEKSLVEPEAGSSPRRYRLLEPVRQYAREHLTAAGELDETQRRHALCFELLAHAAEPRLMSGERGPWMDRLDRERDNLRTALRWSLASIDPRDRETALRLCGYLVFWWTLRGETGEGLEWTETALAGVEDTDPRARAAALYAAGEMAWVSGNGALAVQRAEESESIWRALGDRRRLAYVLQSLPMATEHPRARESVAEALRVFREIGDAWGEALALGADDIFPVLRDGDPTGEREARLEAGLACARRVGDDWLTAQRLNFLGDLARSQGRHRLAEQRYEEALTLLRRQDLEGTVPSLLHNLGYLALRRGESRRAAALFRESLQLFRDQGDQRGMADCLDGLSAVLAVAKQAERAAWLLGAAGALRAATGAEIWPGNREDHDRAVCAARERLGDEGYGACRMSGENAPLPEVLAFALRAPGDGDAPAGSGVSALTPREREVAALVAQGLTNRQIGAALFITEETARLHVKHILQKRGFTSRAQIAAWTAEHNLAGEQR